MPLEKDNQIKKKRKEIRKKKPYSSIKCGEKKNIYDFIGHSIILFGCLHQCESIICQKKKYYVNRNNNGIE